MNKVRSSILPAWRARQSAFARQVRIRTRRVLGGRPRPVAVWTTVLACAAVFSIALGARWLLLADQRATVESAHEVSYTQPRHYQNAGRRILEDPVHALLLDSANDRGRERLLVHPPGYPIFIASVFGVLGDSSETLRVVQIVFDSFSALLVFLIASRLLRCSVAFVAGLVAALSPQLAWNALVLQPDTVAIVPLLSAVLVLVWRPRPTVGAAIAAGALVGISCWLRSNAMLLAPFMALVAVPLLYPRGMRLRAACALVLTAVAAIAPVTIRNWYVLDRFIPLSLGAGITFAEGIGDFDPERRFGLPSTDVEMAVADAEWAGRLDYARATWFPDAIDRDRERFRRAANVAVGNPVWFAGVMARRAALMFRANDDYRLGWPADTTHAPMVSLEPPYGHDRPGPSPASAQVAATTVVDLAKGEVRPLVVIPVTPGVDCVIRVPVSEVSGSGALDVRDDRGSLVASVPIREQGDANRRRRRKANRDQRSSTTELVLPIASRDTRRFELSLRADGNVRHRGLSLMVSQGQVNEVGPTPAQWARGPRWAVRSVQRNVYVTSRWALLVLAGAFVLLLGYRRRALVAVAAVPAYYLAVQSALHTEFRYVLAVHALSAVLVAVAAVAAAELFAAACHRLLGWLRLKLQARTEAEAA